MVSQWHQKDGGKFSMHVVCPTLLFDRSTLGMKSFVTDLAVYVVHRLLKEISDFRNSMLNFCVGSLTAKDRVMLRLIKLLKFSVDRETLSIGKISPIDLFVYKVLGQLFWMVGMGKVKRGRLVEPLVLCKGDGSSAFDVEENYGIGDRGTWFSSLVCNHAQGGSTPFGELPCTWRSSFYLKKDIEWQRVSCGGSMRQLM